MVSEERTGRYGYIPEEGRYGIISASLHDNTGQALALHEPATVALDGTTSHNPDTSLLGGRKRRDSAAAASFAGSCGSDAYGGSFQSSLVGDAISIAAGSTTGSAAGSVPSPHNRRGSVASSIYIGHANPMHTSSSRRDSISSAASASSSHRGGGRNNAAVDANLARSIKTDATKVTVDDELWRQFKSSCNSSGHVTNIAAKEMLREQVMKSKCYHTEKQELVDTEIEEEQRRWARRSSSVLIRDQANQVSTGLRRAFSSALNMVSMEALALQDEVVDVTEQQAILNSLGNSANDRSGNMSLGAAGRTLEGNVQDNESAPTATRALADSLSSSFGSMKNTFSSEFLSALGVGDTDEDGRRGAESKNESNKAEWDLDASSSTSRPLSNRPRRGKRPSMLSSIGSIGTRGDGGSGGGATNSRRSSVESLASASSSYTGSESAGTGSAAEGMGSTSSRRPSYVNPFDRRRSSGRMSSLMLLGFADMEEEMSDYRSDTESEGEQSITPEDIAGPKSTGEESDGEEGGEESASNNNLEANLAHDASLYLASKLQGGDVQEAIGRHQALFRRLSERHVLMTAAATAQRRRSSRRLSLTSSDEGDGSMGDLEEGEEPDDDDDNNDDSGNELHKSFSTIKNYRSRAA